MLASRQTLEDFDVQAWIEVQQADDTTHLRRYIEALEARASPGTFCNLNFCAKRNVTTVAPSPDPGRELCLP